MLDINVIYIINLAKIYILFSVIKSSTNQFYNKAIVPVKD